jgi:hypothetical protein
LPVHESAALISLLASAMQTRAVAAVGTAERTTYLQDVSLSNTLRRIPHWFYPEEIAGVASVDAARSEARPRMRRVGRIGRICYPPGP